MNREDDENIHSCSYYCTRPECVLRQRNKFRDKLLAEPVSLDAKIVHFAKTALHEMPRPATDWHHCAKRVCEAVVALSQQQAEPVVDAVADSGNPSY
jgi:late competence protein required for DNA uptake (superfamily II DNA/RNA helicase)